MSDWFDDRLSVTGLSDEENDLLLGVILEKLLEVEANE